MLSRELLLVVVGAVCATSVGCAPRVRANGFLPVAPASAPEASNVVMRYDWRTHSIRDLRTGVAGNGARIEAVGLNRVCYDYDLDEKQNAAVERTADLFPLIGLPDPSKVSTVLAAAGEKSGKAPGAGETGTTKAKSLPGLVKIATTSRAVVELARIDSLTRDAGEALKHSAEAINAAIDLRAEARRALETFYRDACPAGVRVTSADLTEAWRTAKPKIGAFVSDAPKQIAVSDEALKTAQDALTFATIAIRAFKDAAKTDDNYAAMLGELAMRAQVASFDSVKLVTQKETGGSLRDDAKAVEDAGAAVPRQIADSAIAHSLVLLDNTESVTMTLTTTGKKGIPSVKDVKSAESFTLPVYRRFRAFLSAGFLLSTLEEHDYDREVRVDSAGKPYSTFVDLKGNSSLAFAPAVMSHMTFARSGPVDFALTGGVAARSVKDRISPDFLLGGSAGLGDRVLLTLAFHKGRVEKLDLGDPKTVSQHAVPEEVTRNGAVRDEWKNALALSLSYRLP